MLLEEYTRGVHEEYMRVLLPGHGHQPPRDLTAQPSSFEERLERDRAVESPMPPRE